MKILDWWTAGFWDRWIDGLMKCRIFHQSNDPSIPISQHLMNSPQPVNSLAQEILDHYASGYEAERLLSGVSRLEFFRTQELMQRYLPAAPVVIFDVGGGPGAYSCWLAQLGHEVHLIDAAPLHVEQARQASAAQPDHPIASCSVGDARQLDRAEASVEAVLLLGPLYHLTARRDRIAALADARRIAKPGGFLFAAAISRFASTLDGLFRGLLDDPAFVPIALRDAKDGQHRNPTDHSFYFTTAFFHHPEELRAEVIEAGWQLENVFAIEGPGWLLQNFDEHWQDANRRDRLLEALRWIETEPSMLGASAHLLAVARKPV
jgi:ubiquinone/menaquinone biosynthesis C-methylase UbiE